MTRKELIDYLTAAMLFTVMTLAFAITAQAQTNISAQSYKQGPATTQSITSAAAGTAVDVTGYSFVAVQYKGGPTYTTDATPAGFQVSLDAGTTFLSQAFYVQGTTNTCLLQTVTGDLIDNSTNVWIVPVAGFNRFRTNALNYSSGTIAVTIVPFSSPGSACQQISNFPALNSATDSVAIGSALPGGNNNIGDVDAIQSGTWTVQPGNTANTTPWLVTTNGLSLSATQSAASTNATNVKSSAGVLYDIVVINTTATLYYLRLYNLSSAPTCSSATGFVATYPIPASATGAGVSYSSTHGITFGTGIGFCITGGPTSTDNTNAATGVFVNLGYK